MSHRVSLPHAFKNAYTRLGVFSGGKALRSQICLKIWVRFLFNWSTGGAWLIGPDEDLQTHDCDRPNHYPWFGRRCGQSENDLGAHSHAMSRGNPGFRLTAEDDINQFSPPFITGLPLEDPNSSLA
jgi:hypothetical protein